ncbi:MAG: hypothetical protein WAZ18_06425, partial [Alphaproteobacteria bacterium]
VLSDPLSDALDDAGLAKRLGVGEDIVTELLDEAVVKEAMVRRVAEIAPDELAEVDRAMLMRAKEGHVGAARLLYARMEAKAGGMEDGTLPSLEELEAELAVLRSVQK